MDARLIIDELETELGRLEEFVLNRISSFRLSLEKLRNVVNIDEKGNYGLKRRDLSKFFLTSSNDKLINRGQPYGSAYNINTINRSTPNVNIEAKLDGEKYFPAVTSTSRHTDIDGGGKMNFYEKPGAIEHVSVQKSQEGIEHHVDIDNKLNRKPDFAQRRSTISESNHGICKGKKSITNYNDTVASIKNGNDSLPVADTLSPKTHDQTCKGIHIRIRQDSKLERDESYDAGNENSLAIPSTIRCNQAEPIFPENGSHNHIDRTMKKRVKVSFDEFLKNTSDSGCFESNLYKTSSPLHLDVTNNPDFEQTPGDSIERSDLISTQILNSDSEPLVDTMRSDSTENEIVNRLVSPKSKVYRDVERASVHFRDNSQGVQALPTTSNGVFVHEMSTANSSYGSKIACYKQDNSKLQTNEPTFYNFSVCTEETDPIQTTFNNKNQLDVQLNRGYKPLNISPSTPEAFWDVDFPET